ncbi:MULTISPECIES: hypothetical protein [unclassified Frankia]|uniref:hypothetical protein n=1 Tax=unclassified Frankia TaxID=2632575 RepID=UPI002AD21E89|nr:MULTISPECIES: hypothetical protein [unclassified Frankia]
MVVARQVDVAVPPAPPPVPPPATLSAAGSGESASPQIDLPALVDELYERITRRLRADLLADRERRGLLADPA